MDSVTLRSHFLIPRLQPALNGWPHALYSLKTTYKTKHKGAFYVGRAKTTYFSSFLMDGKANNVFQFQFYKQQHPFIIKVGIRNTAGVIPGLRPM